jgi:hypothetical protein
LTIAIAAAISTQTRIASCMAIQWRGIRRDEHTWARNGHG